MTANVALTDTFDQWRVKSNELIVMTQSDGMNNILKTIDTTNSTSNTTGSIITAGGVGINKSVTIGENLQVHGNVVVDGDTTISGNLVFGDADTDQVTFTADINSHIIPNANLTFNIGNTTMYWANTWTGHLTTEQKTDSGKPALTVSSLDLDVTAVDINAGQTTANIIDVVAANTSTGKGISLTMAGLTTGSALYIDSDSDSTGTRSLATIIQNHTSATGATAMTLQADAGRGLFIDTNLAAGGYSLEIDSEQTTTNVAKIAAVGTSGTTLEVSHAGVMTGKVIDITADAATTGTGLNMSMDGLTTGSMASLVSDSSSTGTRSLFVLHNDNTSATATIPLEVKQDSTNAVAKFTGTSTIILPVGTSSNRGNAVQGGVRYNTTTSAFEGYSGSTWGSLGGVIDVDQDTKIIAETSAGADNDDLEFYTAGTKRMMIDQAGVITVGADDTGYDVTFFGDTASRYWMWDTSADGVVQRGTLTVGVDDTGHDVKFFGATAGKSWLWDESADKMIITGDTQLTGALTIGVDDTGHDVKFFGASTGAFMLYDEDQDTLQVRGGLTNGGTLLLSTAEPSVVDGNRLGRIDFQAPLDAAGTDAIVIGASILAEADATFSASVNSTDLVFLTADSGAATEKLRIDSTGIITHMSDGAGVDIKSFGGTAAAYMEWDASANELELRGPAATPGKLLLSTAETSVVDGNKLGQIDFQAPVDAAGTDAILVGASIHAEADATFSSSVNATELVFSVGASEAATEQMRLTSDGKLGLATSAPASQLHVNGTMQVGVDDVGHDVFFYGATAGCFMYWDQGSDKLECRGGAATPGKLLLSTAETTVVDGNVLGQIEFQAPAEGSGTDAILVGAKIHAEADDTFAADNNATELVFSTGASEAATEKMRLTSDGKLGLATSAPASLLHVGGTVQVGVDGTGYDVNFYGDTAGAFFGWDESADTLKLYGGVILESNVTGEFRLQPNANDAANCTYAFKDDPNTGMIRLAADALALVTAGATRLHINSSGHVGIGGTPATLLHLSTGSSTPTLRIHSDTSSSPNPRIELMRGTNDTFGADAYTDFRIENSGAVLKFSTGESGTTTNRMSMDSTGRVGIGTDSPSGYDSEADNLVLYGSGHTGLTIATGDATARTKIHFADGTSGSDQYRGMIDYDHNDDSMNFRTSGTERMTIRASGAIAFGTATNAVVTSAGCINQQYCATTSDTLGNAASMLYGFGDQPEWGFQGLSSIGDNGFAIVHRNGNTPYWTAQFGRGNNNSNDFIKFFTNNTQRFNIDNAGLCTVTSLTESSYRELKTNISNIENILPAVLQMQGVKFDWREGNDTHQRGKNNYGFIAEDVDEILPNLCSYDEEGNPTGVQYSKMTAVLLEAIKEQQIQINELKSKLN